MKIVIIIPARYQSTRLPGKPIVDIAGKPMIYWVYKQAIQVLGVKGVYLAIDDIRIASVCEKYGMPYVMTRSDHPNHVYRIAEASEKIEADLYICVNGDEPLIKPENVAKVIPDEIEKEKPYAGYLARKLMGIAEAYDISNIKAVIRKDGTCMYLSRGLIPYPKGNEYENYLKLIGVECFNRTALDFYKNAPMGSYEKTEDIDHLRFIENNVDIHITVVESESLSVDTEKDLVYVRKVLEQSKSKNEKM